MYSKDGGGAMKRGYRLIDVEEAVADMELAEIEDDIAETEEDMQLIISGWFVYIESLNLTLREGVVCVWDEEEQIFMPDFSVTVFYEGNMETEDAAAANSRIEDSDLKQSGESMQSSLPSDYLYYEQDGFVISLANWLNGRMSVGEIEQLWCELVIPENIETMNNDEKVED